MGAESRIRVGMTSSTLGEGDMSARKRDIRSLADASAPERRNWLARAAFFHQEDLRYLKFLIPEGVRVLELGCGIGDLLAALKPSFGVGVDFSPGMIAQARQAHPDLTFLVGDIEDAAFVRSLPGPFDVIVVVDTLGARDLRRDRLLLAPVVSGAEIGRGDGHENAAAAAKRPFSRRRARARGARRFRGGQGRNARALSG